MSARYSRSPFRCFILLSCWDPCHWMAVKPSHSHLWSYLEMKTCSTWQCYQYFYTGSWQKGKSVGLQDDYTGICHCWDIVVAMLSRGHPGTLHKPPGSVHCNLETLLEPEWDGTVTLLEELLPHGTMFNPDLWLAFSLYPYVFLKEQCVPPPLHRLVKWNTGNGPSCVNVWYDLGTIEINVGRIKWD